MVSSNLKFIGLNRRGMLNKFQLSLNWRWWLLLGIMVALAGFLRGYHLTQVPPLLYWEEAALGYDAYAVLQTGSDHHGHPWPLVAFESFGDWKASFYFYFLMPSIALFGLSPMSVRLPALVVGLGIVVGVAVLTKLVISRWSGLHSREVFWLPLVAAWITTISPWMIQFSRVAWETYLAAFLCLWGMICALKAFEVDSVVNKFLAKEQVKQTAGDIGIKTGWWLASIVLQLLSMYTYPANRVIAPLLLIGSVAYWLAKNRKVSV